ncbi:MAG: MBG domain-containing protein, partial [Ginsengibacter sp.]
SESLYFFTAAKKPVIVKADDKTKKYGEILPAFTATVTVDGVPLESTGLTSADLHLDNLTYTTPANTASNVSPYIIHPVDPLNPAVPADAAILDQYTFEFQDGTLSVQKLPLKISPKDTMLIYGQQIHGINFNYQLDPLANIQNPDSLINTLELYHGASVLDSLFALLNGGTGTTRRALVNSDFDNMSILVSGGTGTTRRALVNSGSGTTETSYIADVSPESVLNYQDDPATSPLVNGGTGTTRRALVNSENLVNGTAGILVNGGTGTVRRALVNGDPTLLNSSTIGGTSNSNVAVIVSAEDAPDPINNSITTRPANMITGITAGEQVIIPGAFISPNFEISYGIGKLTINKAPLYVTANSISSENGILPPLISTITGYQYQDAATGPAFGPPCTLMPAFTGMPGFYTIKPSPFTFPGDSNYVKIYINGKLEVKPYNRSLTSFTLINAQTDTPIQPIPDGSNFDINTLPFTKLNIRANAGAANPASVVFILDGKIVRTENGAPFAIGGDSPPGDYHYWTLPLGEHTLTAIPYAGSNGKGTAGIPLTIHFTVSGHKVERFTLVNSDSGNELLPVAEGSVIELNALPASKLNIKATTNPARVGSVVFIFDGVKIRTENGAPYSVGGDKPSGDYHSWPLPLGAHTLTAIPYSKANGTGMPGARLTVHFTVQQTLLAQRASPQAANSKKEYEIIAQKTGVFPNPAIDKLMVTTTGQFDNQQRIQVTDMSGRNYFVDARTISSGKIELNIFALQKGMYFIKIKDKDGFKRISFVKL